MGEWVFICLCSYSVIFSSLFWLLSWVFKFFYNNKQKEKKLEFYECGFLSSISIKVHLSLSFFLVLLFFLLYDLEFLGFFFFSFFPYQNTPTTFLIFWSFYAMLLFCFLIDYAFNLLDFTIKN